MNQVAPQPALARWQEYVDAHSTAQVNTLLFVTLFLNLLFEGGTWLLTGQFALDHAHDAALVWPLAVPWSLWLVSSVAQVILARQVRQTTEARVPPFHWVVNTLQLVWLMSLAWYSPVELWLFLGTGVLLAAISDTRFFYDHLLLRGSYFASWLAFDLVLLMIDLAGGPGLLYRLETDQNYVFVALLYQLLLLVIQQVMLKATGVHWSNLDTAIEDRGKAETALAVAQRERTVLTRACDLLEPGLTAAQFSHDVATPISTMGLCTDEIVAILQDLDPDDSEGAQEVVVDLKNAQDELMLLTSALVKSIKGGASSVVDAQQLAEEAIERARAKVPSAPRPVLALDEGGVLAREHHATVIGNLLGNGMRERPDVAMELSGGPVDGGWYLLKVRDHGVAPEDRETALTKVRASLDLTPDTDNQQAGRPVKGYGLALVLAKVHLVRFGGWLRVDAPDDGRGLVFSLLMPSVDAPLGDPVAVMGTLQTLGRIPSGG